MSQKQNIDCTDLFESAANEAKRLKWSQDISEANFQLKRLHEQWVDYDKKVKNRKEQIIHELAEKLEEHGMPREYIMAFIIRKLAPDGYMPETTIRRILKKSKYELEDSPVENPPLAESDDNNSTGQSTIQVSGDSNQEEDFEALPPTRAVKKLQEKLADTEQTLQKKEEEINFLRSTQPVQDIPQLVDNKIGPVEIRNLSKINEFDRRGYQILASRFGEIVRRKLNAEGKATIKLYILGKDRTTNIEYLVPVNFVVDMFNKSTDMTLDETRL